MVSILTLSPPMWLGSDSSSVLAQEELRGVTRGAALAGANPLGAIKRLGGAQKRLLSRIGRATGRKSSGNGRRQAVRPYQSRPAYNTVKGGRGRSVQGGVSQGEATLQGLGRIEYMRLAGRLSGQSCESIEGGVIVRRGC